MAQTEWIISLDDDLKDHDELFVGNVRDGDMLTRCKDCAHYHNWAHCPMFFAIYRTGYEQNPDDYCSRAERKE